MLSRFPFLREKFIFKNGPPNETGSFPFGSLLLVSSYNNYTTRLVGFYEEIVESHLFECLFFDRVLECCLKKETDKRFT